MSIRRMAWAACCLLFWLLGPAVQAQAEVRVDRTPAGWVTPASAEANERAADWASNTGARVMQVFSTRSEDGFSETLAVLALRGPMQADARDRPTEALAAAVGELFTTEPLDATWSELDAAATVIKGRWEEDGVSYQVALASAGPSRGLAIVAVRVAETSLYDGVFDDVIDELRGASPSLQAFDVRRWRWGLGIGWVVFVAVAWFITRSRPSGSDGPGSVGRTVGIACTLAAMLGSVVVFAVLADSGPMLRVARLSRPTIVTEFAVAGLAVAMLAWLYGMIREGSVRRIDSAPTGGTFAERRPPSSSGSGRREPGDVVSGRHDGPSNLASAADSRIASVPSMSTETPAPAPSAKPSPRDASGQTRANAKAGKKKPLETLVGVPSVAEVADDDPELAALLAQVEAKTREHAEAASGRGSSRPDPAPSPAKTPEGTIVGPAPAPPTAAPPARGETVVGAFPPPMNAPKK